MVNRRPIRLPQIETVEINTRLLKVMNNFVPILPRVILHPGGGRRVVEDCLSVPATSWGLRAIKLARA